MPVTSEGVIIFSAPYPEGSRNSHELLRRAAGEYSVLTEEQLGPLETAEKGKPFFPEHPELHFSITHSGDWWLCGFSREPLGLDLQIYRSYLPPAKLSRRFFHPLEDAFLAKENHVRFFDVWCAKESWVKYTGRGFYDPPDSFSLVSSDGEFPSLEGVSFHLIDFQPEYSMCLCTKNALSWRILEL